MNAAKYALLLSAPMFLTACGGASSEGGGGSSIKPTTYTWQFVHLASVDRSSVAKGCAILSPDTSDSTGSKVIAAYKAGNTSNFNILFHDESGHVTNKFSADSNGQFVINESLVPNNGYVSLEEVDGSIVGNSDVYMFTVQKPYLSNMMLNVRQGSTSYPCYKGEQYSVTTTDPNAALNVNQVSSNTTYYQTSNIDNAVNGRGDISSQIPVDSDLPAQTRILVTLFDSYTNSEATQLTHYAIAEKDKVFNINDGSSESTFPTDANIISPSLSAVGLTVNNESRIDVNIDDHIYTWQNIYSSSADYSVIDGSSEISGWTFNLAGDAGNGWLAQLYAPVKTSGTTIDIPALQTNTGINVSNAGCNGDYCLSVSSYVADDFQLQRTHLRSTTTNDSRNFYQTIFATPKTDQVLMDSSTGEELNPNSMSDRLEVSLAQMDVNNNNAVELFMSDSINPQELISATPGQYYDVNGLISMPSEYKQRRLALMGSEVQIYKNGTN